MPFNEMASKAMSKAMEVFEKLSALSATVDIIKGQVTDFRDEARKRMADNEARIEARLALWEKRVDDKIDRVEARQRELETRLAQVEGKVEGALAEAYVTVALKRGGNALPPHEG